MVGDTTKKQEASANFKKMTIQGLSMALTNTTDSAFELLCRQELKWFTKYTEISRRCQVWFSKPIEHVECSHRLQGFVAFSIMSDARRGSFTQMEFERTEARYQQEHEQNEGYACPACSPRAIVYYLDV